MKPQVLEYLGAVVSTVNLILKQVKIAIFGKVHDRQILHLALGVSWHFLGAILTYDFFKKADISAIIQSAWRSADFF